MTAPDTALPTTYNAAATEPSWYARWTEHGVFTADPVRGATREPFVIVIPPPNVTAVLHMGHGLNNTVQDVLIRWRRMAGDEALWVPGTDHAGIATQNVVEKQLAAHGQTRFDLGREPFVQRVAEFVDKTGGEILNQLKSIGSSADWTRTAYTFSPELSRAVRETFVRLHEDGLVYKGHRVIHWCPRCGTSLSDEEAEFTDTNGKLYHLRYPLADDPTRGITVATTRPETMLGDVAVAVNPDDERYQALIGKHVVLPLNGVRIPIVGDSYTDPAFGSGAVKITPAHDANDFEVAKRHALAMPVIIDAEGIVREVEGAAGRVPDALRGLDRFAARKAIVMLLEEAGALQKIEPHAHSVRHCYRCDTVVEPRLSDQWFVRMQPLADKALAALRTGELRILPERWEAVYVNWLEGIRDWNISRQIWWGHRVPVWYCTASCGHAPIVSRTDVTSCPGCGGTVRQDDDVLDTWFSSWLWPFSTLGWPDDTPDLKAFYPGDVLVTAPEILFFWVARMVMSGCWFMGKAPFHTVYLHGTVRDMQHRKMSKSLGNGIDPLDVVQLYGADALRWTMVSGLGLGVDVMLDPSDLDKSFSPGRNFCTKLWNIGRFLLSRVGSEPVAPVAQLDRAQLAPADRWILERLDVAIADCDAALGPARPGNGATWSDTERGRGLRLSEYAEAARRFVWNELADWYLESIKPRLAAEGTADREVARAVLAHAFDGALRLLHPVVPFITEELWQKLPQTTPGTFLAQAAWPVPSGEAPGAGDAFELVRAAVAAIRQVRSEYNVNPGAWVDAVLVATGEAQAVMTLQADTVGSLARAKVRVEHTNPGGAAAQLLLAGGVELVVPLAGMVDLDKEKQRLETEIAQLDKQLTALEGRLANAGFVAKAPPAVVEAERTKAAEWGARLTQLRDKLATLGA
ncbi:valine--tRNA ligase [Gemmatimonas sp.]|uniref:valine--tRNA ligase n=1 Tax=Gemmatimonas sp. TaxID=1962908 RepID=UPI0022CBD2E5|nr:valine--tRNA ligase [Gemmatimonas sp.]MCZ8204689.1 valine--tRNA ligase [Gemmatimonas sp.]